uniref:KIX domain-containing protein n=1 Tax=Meloidogyne enterolobii TaxID=390850 RepID=A0A6V7VUS5_MELEN|nr:unnamed protein product [Meloidogyne enterolobii]
MEEIVNKVVDQVCEEDADDEGRKEEVEEENKEAGGEGRFEEVNGRQKEEEEGNEVEEEGEIFEEEEEEKLEDEEKLEEVNGGQKEEEEHKEEREDEEECEEIEIKREENVEDEKYGEEEKEEEENENNLEIEEEEEEAMEQVKEDDYSSRKSSKHQEDVEEIEQKVSTNLLTQNVPQVTADTLTQSNKSNRGGIFNSSISQQRPKRNRARRLYTPSPPPRFGGESKRKRESDDSLASTSLQTSSNPKKISWAKEQPRQVHSANKPQKQQPDHPTPHPPLSSQSLSSQQQNIDPMIPNSSSSLSSSSHFASHPPPVVKFGHSIPPAMSKPPSTFGYSNQQTQMQTVQQAQHVVVLLRQNEKLAKEVASLKRLNQEQQQQIQSLISANRELIWAFNESRREHEELMKQLKTLMASNSNKNINNNSNGNVGQQQIGGGNNSNSTSNQQQQQQKQQPVVPKMEVVVPRRILSKTSTNTNKSSSDLQRSEKKLQQPGEISSYYQPAVFALSKPKKSKVVDNKTTLRTSAKSQQKPQQPKQPQKQQQQQPQKFSNVPSSEQKLVNLPSVEVKKETEDVGEIINRILPQNVEQKKRTKEEEIESIKEELNILKSNPDSSKFLGQRRPAFFTPKEFGDWHSVVSGDLRKQFVLKIFQALCPEVTQKCIDDYNKAYPSRVDYIKKSVNFSFETENDLFVNSKSKELYIGLIAEKIFTLREAISRFSTTNTTTTASSGGSSDSNDERRNSSGNSNGNIKRKLADVLKRTTRSIGSNE